MYAIGSRETIAAFDVDAQNCFTPLCPDELPVPDGHHIVAELNRQARLAVARVGSKDAHPADAVWVAAEEHPQLTPVTGHKNVDLRWNQHAVPGTKGFELVSGLPDITEYDYFVWKGVEVDIHPYGACFHDLAERLSTGVIEFIASKGITTVLVGGLALDFCVKTTAVQLQRAGFQVYVNRAATRGLAESSIAAAITELNAAGVILVDSADDLIIADTVSDASAI